MEILNVGGPELILLLFFAGVLLGPRRMVLLAREIGEFLNQIKSISRNLTKELNHEIDMLDREMRITQPVQLAGKTESRGVEAAPSPAQPDTVESPAIAAVATSDQPPNGHELSQSTKDEGDSHLPEAYKRFIEDFPGEGLEDNRPETESLEKEVLEIQPDSSAVGAPTD
jgi:Sec-independent protein translocase protein TatA